MLVQNPGHFLIDLFVLLGSLNLELGNLVEAEKIYKDLIKRNPENWMYYENLELCLARQNKEECCKISTSCAFTHMKVVNFIEDCVFVGTLYFGGRVSQSKFLVSRH